ncbi:hypothetical protein [Campylobacter sputorum]|uniref:hypothetical protein n=1 Tax=Campylobacter sputorum TaxID=206 RepID=UPI000B79744D|nr:hypothetical protein [Campylobacter sputorum]ASM36513.1 hypothetical protein CSF_0618 [Campylobacter sputorum bv. faecalis CCUG 20703]
MKNLLLKITALVILSCSYAFGVYGTLSGERTDGLSKICYYSTPYGTKAITIKSYEVCPVSYDF